jgi:hypothetical protein
VDAHSVAHAEVRQVGPELLALDLGDFDVRLHGAQA